MPVLEKVMQEKIACDREDDVSLFTARTSLHGSYSVLQGMDRLSDKRRTGCGRLEYVWMCGGGRLKGADGVCCGAR